MNDSCHHDFVEDMDHSPGDLYVEDSDTYLWFNLCSNCGRKAYRKQDTDNYFVEYSLIELTLDKAVHNDEPIR